MHSTGDDGMMACEFGTLWFLIDQQIRVIDDLERRGADGRAARDLLRRLMHQERELRRGAAEPEARRVA